jgi:hypothetical protein
MSTRSFVLLGLLLVILPPAIASPRAQPPIRFTMSIGKPVVDGVFLDGHGPFRFLLDTGTQTNLLDSELASTLGLRSSAEQYGLYTPSGQSIVQGGRVGKVDLGSMEAVDQEFLFTSFKVKPTLPQDVRGILGQEFLSHFDYMLDLQHHRLIVGGPPAAGAPIKVQLVFGRMAVPTSLGSLVLDSGAEMLTLFRQSSHAANAQLRGASGLRVPASIEAAPELGIGDKLYHLSRAEYLTVPGAEEAGLLPANIFHAIFISNSKSYIVFNPPAPAGHSLSSPKVRAIPFSISLLRRREVDAHPNN